MIRGLMIWSSHTAAASQRRVFDRRILSDSFLMLCIFYVTHSIELMIFYGPISVVSIVCSRPGSVAQPGQACFCRSSPKMVKVLIMLCLSVSGLDLPDLWSELESPDLKIPMVKQPESFLPTVNQIENMADSESQGRNHWYLSAFVSVFLLIMLLGTTIMKIGPMLKECVLGSPGYKSVEQQAVLPTLGVEEQRNLVVIEGYQSPEQQAVLPTLGVEVQRKLVVIVFGLSLTAVSCSCFWAMRTHRLSKSSGLDWELYMALFSLVGVGLLIQAVVAVCRLPAGEKFAMSAFPVACATSMIPTLSDYFDTLKDVIFTTLCLNSDRYFIRIMGICSWIYLVAIHVYFVFYRQNCLAELCGTYVPLIAVPPAPKGTKESGDGIWSGTLLPLLYKQLTPTKRELLLWENVPQAGFSIIFLLEEGGSIFVSFVNLALPAFQVILAFALFRWVRAAVGPHLGKQLNGAMAANDFLKAQRIWEEAGRNSGRGGNGDPGLGLCHHQFHQF